MGRPGLSLNRKFRRLERALQNAALARGVLELIWDGAYEAGDPYIGDAADVAARAGWAGDEQLLCAALVDAGGRGHAGFIEAGGSSWWPDGAPGTYRVHDLYDHAPDYVQKRLRREEERRSKGQTISAIRSEAGKRGALAAARAKESAPGRQPSSHLPPDGISPHAPKDTAPQHEKQQQTSVHLPDTDQQAAATVRQIALTPAPAPAPAPQKNLADARSDQSLNSPESGQHKTEPLFLTPPVIRSRKPVPEQATACRQAWSERWDQEYRQLTGEAYAWSAADRQAVVTVCNLVEQDMEKAVHLLEEFLRRCASDQFYAKNRTPRFIASKLNELRVPLPTGSNGAHPQALHSANVVFTPEQEQAHLEGGRKI